jgi:hypothetical protein
VATVEIFQLDQRPALPAARIWVTHQALLGRSGAWAPPMPGACKRPLTAVAQGTTVSIGHLTAGAGIAYRTIRFTGDVSGVPPRGRPV